MLRLQRWLQLLLRPINVVWRKVCTRVGGEGWRERETHTDAVSVAVQGERWRRRRVASNDVAAAADSWCGRRPFQKPQYTTTTTTAKTTAALPAPKHSLWPCPLTNQLTTRRASESAG